MSNQPNLRTGLETAHGLERRSVIAALATAGIVGPLLFVLVVIVQSLLPADYRDTVLPISALTAWPGG